MIDPREDALVGLERARSELDGLLADPALATGARKSIQRAHGLLGGALGDVAEGRWDRARLNCRLAVDDLEAVEAKLPIGLAGRLRTAAATVTIAGRHIDAAGLEATG
jgi:hypothetical protein